VPRGGDSLSYRDVVAYLHSLVADLGAFEHHVLQVSGKDKDQALRSVINALQSARFRIDTLDESNR
jgi:hypothetical protein